MSVPDTSDVIRQKIEIGRAYGQIKDIFDNHPDLEYEDFPSDQKAMIEKAKISIRQSKIEIGKRLSTIKKTVTPSQFLGILKHIGESIDGAQNLINLASNAE